MNQQPLVSIVTPSFNQGPFLEETIRSVLNQSYTHIEYLIIDGGSTDQSVNIIKSFSRSLAYWVSEPDNGQADAIQKGFEQANGSILAYLNADDAYLPGTVEKVVAAFQSGPQVSIFHGHSHFIDTNGNIIGTKIAKRGIFMNFFTRLINPISQPSAFFTRRAWEVSGGIDSSFNVLMDFDLWSAIGLRNHVIEPLDVYLSRFRVHPESKTSQRVLEFAQEREKLVRKYTALPATSEILKPYVKSLDAYVALYYASAYLLDGDSKTASIQLRHALNKKPGLIFTRRGLSLITRLILGRRYFRKRLVDKIYE